MPVISVLSQLWIPSTWHLEPRRKQRLVKCLSSSEMPCCPWAFMNLSRQKTPSFKWALLYNGVYSTHRSRVNNTTLAPYHFFLLSMKHLKWKWLLSTPRDHVRTDLLSRWVDRHGGEFHYTLLFEWQEQLTLGPSLTLSGKSSELSL